MTVCPIAIAVGCKKCPAFSVCPLKSVLGDQPSKPEADAKAGAEATQDRRRRQAPPVDASPPLLQLREIGCTSEEPGRRRPHGDRGHRGVIDAIRRHHRLGQVHAAGRAVQRRPRDVHRHRRRVDHAAHRHPASGASRTSPASSSPHVAAPRALACAGIAAADIDLIVYGSCSNDEQIPNTASGPAVQARREQRGGDGRQHRLHELPLRAVDRDRDDPHRRRQDRAGRRRRGDRAVHGLDATATSRCCSATARPRSCCRPRDRAGGRARREARLLRRRAADPARARHGLIYAQRRRRPTATRMWDFDGQEIFKRAVVGMSEASADVLATCGHDDRRHRPRRAAPGEPAHHRVRRGKRSALPMDKVFLTVQRYGNMSAATVPVALVDALEEGRVAAGLAAAHAGVRRRPHLVLAPDPLGRARRRRSTTTDIDLPPCDAVGARDGARVHGDKGVAGRSTAGLNASRFPSGLRAAGGRPPRLARMPGQARYEVTSLRCACTLIRMPSPMNSDTSAVPP